MVLLAGAIACAPNPVFGFTGTDAGKPEDAGKSDAGVKHTDAGVADAGADAGADGGPADSGPPDAGDAGFDAGVPLTGNVCPAGSTPLEGFTLDLCASNSLGSPVPLPDVQVATLQPYGATLSDSNGDYTICVPPDAPVTLVFTIPGYVTMYEAEIAVSSSIASVLESVPLLGEMDMVCETAVQNYGHEVLLFNANEAAVYSVVFSASASPGPTTCDPADGGYSGWSLQATMVDGGAGPGGPWPTAYFDDSGNLESVAVSFSNGHVFMYNIDPAVGYVSVTGSNPALQGECQLLNPLLLTGRVYVAPGSISFSPWVMP
jgi:hypothetical protein